MIYIKDNKLRSICAYILEDEIKLSDTKYHAPGIGEALSAKTTEFNIPREDLDTYIQLLTVIRNAEVLGMDIKYKSIYRRNYDTGIYALGVYEDGLFTCLAYISYTDSGEEKIYCVHPITALEHIEMDKKELEVWPPPKEEEKHLLEPISLSEATFQCTKCGEKIDLNNQSHVDLFKPCPGKKV